MLFNSLDFLLFSLLFFLLWPLFRKKNNPRWSLLVVASFFFYGWWDWRFLFLILFSGLIDYAAGILIVEKPQWRQPVFAFSLLGNLGSLSVFKYSTFFATVFQDAFSLGGVEVDLVAKIPEFALILPVGISFYTFQSLSYTIDIYRGRLQPTRNILHFFSYLAMFPQLVAGPIVRAKDLLQQLKTVRVPNAQEKWNAMKMICFGLFQKMVIADNLSFFVDSAYQGKTGFDGTLYWWAVAVAFSFQIYCDFSGYSLIARGLAKYMGYHFKMNFNHPYLSTSLRQFWNRWHISLSTWFRDYVYIPLGGSRSTLFRSVLALTVTMLLSGLWHGANYVFLVWAALHVGFLLLERHTKWNKRWKLSPLVLIPLIFVQVTVAWVYFRATDMGQANAIVVKLFSFAPSDLNFALFYSDYLIFLLMGIGIEIAIYFRKTNFSVLRFYHRSNLDVMLVAVSILMSLFFRGEGQQFIYFQF